jgi:hypothetical protein
MCTCSNCNALRRAAEVLMEWGTKDQPQTVRLTPEQIIQLTPEQVIQNAVKSGMPAFKTVMDLQP